MDRLAQIDREALVRRLRDDFERTVREVADAVNAAPDGRLIDGSEERCRDALGEFGRLAYEAAVQMRVEATEADPAFPPAGQSRPRRGVATRTVLSGNGRVTLRRRRRYADPAGGTGVPVDDLVDAAGAAVSLAAREMCCRAATDGGSLARAAASLGRLAGLSLSDETVRRVAESEGRAVVAWQDDGQLELAFDAGAWPAEPTPTPPPTTPPPPSRAYVGVDGFMLPVVTDAEAGRRFDAAVARRRAVPRRRGVRRPRLARRPGADQRYKEAKLVVAYDQARSRRLARAARTGGVRRAGRVPRQVAADVRLRRADQVVAVTDGAEWIANLLATDLPRPTGAGATTTLVPDYFYAAEHVHAARQALFGEAGPDGDAWVTPVLAAPNDGPFDRLWDGLARTRAKVRAPAKRAALDGLMRYPAERRPKVDYAAFRAAGLDVGSGPTEAMCKALSRRMKGVGMRWAVRNLEPMVALEALHQSDLWPAYWSSRLAD